MAFGAGDFSVEVYLMLELDFCSHELLARENGKVFAGVACFAGNFVFVCQGICEGVFRDFVAHGAKVVTGDGHG